MPAGSGGRLPRLQCLKGLGRGQLKLPSSLYTAAMAAAARGGKVKGGASVSAKQAAAPADAAATAAGIEDQQHDSTASLQVQVQVLVPAAVWHLVPARRLEASAAPAVAGGGSGRAPAHLSPISLPAAAVAAAGSSSSSSSRAHGALSPPPPPAAGGQLPGVAHPMLQAMCCQGCLSPRHNAALLCGEALSQLRPWAGWYLVHAAVAPQQVGRVPAA
jgi:hypothetical protein